nr:hypothetical protein [Ilumatobacteraceae bacterium]
LADVDGRDGVITAAELEQMSEAERAQVIQASVIRSWDDVAEPFRSEVLATAERLSAQRRAGA